MTAPCDVKVDTSPSTRAPTLKVDRNRSKSASGLTGWRPRRSATAGVRVGAVVLAGTFAGAFFATALAGAFFVGALTGAFFAGALGSRAGVFSGALSGDRFAGAFFAGVFSAT